MEQSASDSFGTQSQQLVRRRLQTDEAPTETGANVSLEKSEKKTEKGTLDRDPSLWHGRRSSSDVVRQHAEDAEEAMSKKGQGQGLWTGVVFPCTANILGVILFLRGPWIVGKAGIANAFGLVFVCCTCTFITTLSLSAVATNGKIMAGGSYYLISRSLGPALGAGVGLCFYMANSIGAAMYFMGTVEAWESAQPNHQILTVGDINNIRVTAFCILVVAVLVVAGGIKYVVRLGTVFLFVVLFVLVCMYLGCFIGPDQTGTTDSTYTVEVVDPQGTKSKTELVWGGLSSASSQFNENFGSAWDAQQASYPQDTTLYGFVSMMGLWFPANTGIMAGSNRSADLADPSASIPKGTLMAQLFTSFLYLSFIVIYGCVAPRRTLLDDKFFAATAAFPFKEVVIYGVMASSLGAGLTSLVSGTRLLSAIAGDNTLPILRYFAATPGKEPRLALGASGILCACAIAIGELNAVAPILTMFFLMCYTCVNTSCLICEALQDPNWRPRFRFHHWTTSLLGTLLCIWMMFAISALQAIFAIIFCSVVMGYSAFNSHAVKWGDGFQGMKFQVARNILMKIDSDVHTKNWRPQLLVITSASVTPAIGDQEEQLHIADKDLLKFVSQLKGGRGITILGCICSSHGVPVFDEGGLFVNEDQEGILSDGTAAIKRLLKEYRIEGFGHLMYTEHTHDGIQCLVQTAGLGSFQPNCIMAAWPSEWDEQGRFGYLTRSHLMRLIQMGVVFNKVVLLAKSLMWPSLDGKLAGTIDIWWIVGDGGVLLLLPFLLKKNRVWHGCQARIFLLADKGLSEAAVNKMRSELEMYIKDFRLDIQVYVKVQNTAGSEEIGVNDVELSPKRIASSRSVGDSPKRMISAPAVMLGKPTSTSTDVESSNLGLGSLGELQRSVSDRDNTCKLGQAPFITSARQLTSAGPCSPEELNAAAQLNQLILEESAKAELVVLNLPDMPGDMSSFGYCQLVEEMTKGLQRTLLVRGTAKEVIAQFT
eukprot:TRINITY_DN8465_c0_g1_i1.p1 TRINITY_DN8465_c0_g1~~TRINITY_DN8465_c0_g1_i1.p1  ORF type:complete len:1014 (+),score=127.58 TRINITY_DN8465_c0_g1_i1:70-3042(+)